MKTKSFKILALGAAGLLLLGHAASAQLKIYIAGSNGDRTATQTAIANVLTGETFVGSAAPTSANYGIWSGNYGATAVTVKVSFIGATGAIKALAGSQTVPFLADGTTGQTAANDPTTNGNPDNHVPDFIVSSNFQSTSPFQGVYQGHTYVPLIDTLTGVIPLKYAASPGFPAASANITSQLAQLLYTQGALPLALFTGLNSDENKVVYAIGRNTDAGQRYISLTEAGLGTNTVVQQYKPVVSGATTSGSLTYGGTVSSHALWPIETISGVDSQFLGNSGYTTGANLAPSLTVTLNAGAYQTANPSATAGYYIGYLTVGDANTRVLGGSVPAINRGVELKWNGITESDAAIQEGQYTLWAYSHILRKSSLNSGNTGNELIKYNLYESLKSNIISTAASSAGILIGTLNVQRDGEGTPVYPLYF
jgi:hypothetical protein